MKSLFLIMGLAMGLVAPHDFFISILTIRHSAEQRTLDLTWQITAHELEHALSTTADLRLGSANEYPQADSLLNAYFQDHLKLTREGKEMHWKWIGKELEGEQLFCYMQIDRIEDANGLSLSNTLLQEVFADQENLVHLERQDLPTLSYKFVGDMRSYRFSWSH